LIWNVHSPGRSTQQTNIIISLAVVFGLSVCGMLFFVYLYWRERRRSRVGKMYSLFSPPNRPRELLDTMLPPVIPDPGSLQGKDNIIFRLMLNAQLWLEPTLIHSNNEEMSNLHGDEVCIWTHLHSLKFTRVSKTSNLITLERPRESRRMMVTKGKKEVVLEFGKRQSLPPRYTAQ